MWFVSELVVFAVLAFFCVLPPIWAWRFVLQWYKYKPRNAAVDEELPKVAIVLCLRGADPSLIDCLKGLLSQNYPAYSLRIIIDSVDDPAWDLVKPILAEQNPGAKVEVQVDVLQQRRETCSLKVSSQIQAVLSLDESIEVVALIDADVVPDQNWLRDLATPFQDSRIGATTGIRWFAPKDIRWGTLVRYLWNAAACTQMYSFHIPWGGSLAFRTSILRSHLLSEWSHSFCEDTCAYGVLREMGLQLHVVSQGIMINSESTDLPSCCSFIRRQLLCARLHHANWKALLACNIGNALALGAAGVLAIAGAFVDAWHWTAWLGGLVAFYVLSLAAATVAAETSLRRIVRGRGEALPPVVFTWRFLVLGPLTQLLYFVCLFTALWMRRVAWRGITYEFLGAGKLRLLEYRPYQPHLSKTSGSLL